MCVYAYMDHETPVTENPNHLLLLQDCATVPLQDHHNTHKSKPNDTGVKSLLV